MDFVQILRHDPPSGGWSTVNGSKAKSKGQEDEVPGRDPKESDKRIWGPRTEALAPSARPVQCICSRTGKETEVRGNGDLLGPKSWTTNSSRDLVAKDGLLGSGL